MDKRIMTNVVLTGTFDPLHDGHRYFFRKAKNYGDRLYVGITSDNFIINKKCRQPLSPQNDRALEVFMQPDVDEVLFLPDGDKTIDLILGIPPHVYCFGPGQYPEDIEWNRRLMEILKQNIPGIEIHNIEALDREIFNSTRIREEKMMKEDDIAPK